jgi:hypothetical protein
VHVAAYTVPALSIALMLLAAEGYFRLGWVGFDHLIDQVRTLVSLDHAFVARCYLAHKASTSLYCRQANIWANGDAYRTGSSRTYDAIG